MLLVVKIIPKWSMLKYMKDEKENQTENIREEVIENAAKQSDGNPPMFDDDFGPDHVWVDDGTTSFANMDLTRPSYKQKNKKKSTVDLEKKEYRAVKRAAYMHYLPMYLCLIFGFTLAMVLIYFWLS